jgi:hypothetical protein
LKFGGAPFAPECRFVAIDPDGTVLDRAVRFKGAGLVFGCIADTYPTAEILLSRGHGRVHGDPAWLEHFQADWK